MIKKRKEDIREGDPGKKQYRRSHEAGFVEMR